MGINLFMILPRKFDAEYIKGAVEKINGLYGEDEDGQKPYDAAKFDWCDIFKGPEGHLLSVNEACDFEDEAAPWGIIGDDFNWFDTKEGTEDWRNTLKQHSDHIVLFLKARM